MTAWLTPWFGFRDSHRTQVVEAVAALLPSPPRVQPPRPIRVDAARYLLRPRVRSLQEWTRLYGRTT